MATKTRRQLIDSAGEKLGVLASGQILDDEDVSRIDGYVDATVGDLRERDIYYVADVTEIPEDIFTDLAVIVANAARHSFGLSGSAELQAAALAAERSLIIKSGGGPTFVPLKTAYF